MNRLLIGIIAGLALAVAALGSYVVLGDGDTTEASPAIDCSVTTEGTSQTVTCTGTVDPPGPFEPVSFTLVVVALDNPPAGPSFDDDIVSCTLDIGSGPQPINYGPCP